MEREVTIDMDTFDKHMIKYLKHIINIPETLFAKPRVPNSSTAILC
jgi:hypothetical protein